MKPPVIQAVSVLINRNTIPVDNTASDSIMILLASIVGASSISLCSDLFYKSERTHAP